MKRFFTILICKLLRVVGKLFSGGSTMPGRIALKLFPDILSHMQLPKYIIAVTGSNGKTSTTNMIYHILKKNGKSVAWNFEGSNQIEGVTTMILANSTMGGKVKKDVLLIESDERYAQYTFNYFQPTHYVINNLFRDQLTRNGHPEFVYDQIAASIHDGVQLILNADDPLVSTFGKDRKNVIWFGADKLSTDTKECDSVYNDGAYCPVCKAPMKYSTYHFNHVGHYACTSCDFRRHEPDYRITSVDLKEGWLEIDGKYRVNLTLKSLYNSYNILAAYSVAALLGIDGKSIAEAMDDYVMRNDRIKQFTIGERTGTLLTSKHENSISYDHSLRVVRDSDKEAIDVMIIVDKISRKYYARDVSWLWDIDFEMLNQPNINEILLVGTYSSDLAVRLSFTDIPQEKIVIYRSIPKAMNYLRRSEREEYLYTITCFSDKNRFLSMVKEV